MTDRHLHDGPPPFVRHRQFNPAFDGLWRMCEEKQVDGFALLRIVPVAPFEAIAVFVHHNSEPK